MVAEVEVEADKPAMGAAARLESWFGAVVTGLAEADTGLGLGLGRQRAAGEALGGGTAAGPPS